MENHDNLTIATGVANHTILEVALHSSDDFLKIKETLTRIGVASRKTNTLFQSCHILHKRGRYYIVHFKELFILDGKPSNLSESDVLRRNTIACLLEDWGLLKVVDPAIADNTASVSQIKIISFQDKDQWNLESKYKVGKRKSAFRI